MSRPTATRGAKYRATVVPAPGVAAIPHLEAFLPECARLVRAATPSWDADSVAGWGFKPTARFARRLAAGKGWPYLALEDGFLRSVGLGEAGAPAISLLVDDRGVYYDARGPSRLEEMLESGDLEDEALLGRARDLISRIVGAGLSKVNAAPPLPAGALPRTLRRRLLVVDQTAGDASIVGGLASSETFAAMLAAARRDDPDAEILVRRHPAVAAGLKAGCIPAGMLEGLAVIDLDCRLSDILERVDGVYTVSSLAGFEALMRGLPVRCFGMPWYAGWGATRDEIVCQRRTRYRSVEALFAAAYLLMPRYVDPLTGEPCSPEKAVERLIVFRDRADLNAGFHACLGFAPWKHGSARTLLYSPRGETDFYPNVDKAIAAAREKGGKVVFWAARETPAIAKTLAAAGAPVLRMEDGFIRSQGLGSDFHRAASVALDDLGVYYDPSRPSRLEVLLETAEFDAATLRRAAALRARLVAAGLSKYNLWSSAHAPNWPRDRFKLLVVGQVENDKSILRGCESVRTNLGLIRAAREVHPHAFLIYKPHPDVASGNRPGVVSSADVRGLVDEVCRAGDIDTCLVAADGLATMTSLAGFEALLRDKPVWTFGRPFFAGWGLTHDALAFERRTRRLTLDQLAAGALIAYPIYIDPLTGLPCGPEEVIGFLERARAGEPARKRRRIRYWRALFESTRRRALVRY